MPKVKLAKKMWALGLVLTLLTFNLAYVKASVNEGVSSPASKVGTNKLSEDAFTKPPDSNSTKTTVTSDKKKAPGKTTAKTATDCACACPAPTSRAGAAAGRWWDCVQGCLRSWGVSPTQLAMCGTACALGAVPVCAICLGISATVMMLCSIGCGTYAHAIDHSDDPDHVPILVKNLLRKNGRKTERRTLAYAARK